jgi:hypothetical protein
MTTSTDQANVIPAGNVCPSCGSDKIVRITPATPGPFGWGGRCKACGEHWDDLPPSQHYRDLPTLTAPDVPPVRFEGTRTTRPIVRADDGGVTFPLTDLRAFPTVRLVPVRGRPYLRATCKVRVIYDDARIPCALESNLLDLGHWDAHEADYWPRQLCLTEAEALACEAEALSLVM